MCYPTHSCNCDSYSYLWNESEPKVFSFCVILSKWYTLYLVRDNTFCWFEIRLHAHCTSLRWTIFWPYVRNFLLIAFTQNRLCLFFLVKAGQMCVCLRPAMFYGKTSVRKLITPFNGLFRSSTFNLAFNCETLSWLKVNNWRL